MRVIRMGIDRMGMIVMMMVVVVPVLPIVMMVLVVMMVMHVQPAGPGAERIAQRALRDIRPRSTRPLAFDVMVVAFLHRANLSLESQNPRAVLAQYTGRRRHCAKSRMPSALGRGNLDNLLALDGQNLRAIGAGPTIGRRHRTDLFGHPLGEGGQHFRDDRSDSLL